MKNWIPTTHEIFDVTNESQLVLPANDDARIRMLIPATAVTVWIGLGVAASPGSARLPLRLRPWFEKTNDMNELMFRGDIYAAHDNAEPGVTIPMLVLEGEEEPPP